MIINKCPICGSELLANQRITHIVSTELDVSNKTDGNGEIAYDYTVRKTSVVLGTEQLKQSHIACAKDHTVSAMMEYLAKHHEDQPPHHKTMPLREVFELSLKALQSIPPRRSKRDPVNLAIAQLQHQLKEEHWASDAEIEQARAVHSHASGNDEVEIDDGAMASRADSHLWVQAWVMIEPESEESADEEGGCVGGSFIPPQL